MGDSKTNAPKTSKWKALQAEFKKIIWPDKITLLKQTIAVVSVSVVLGAVISVVDAILKIGIDFLVR